MRIRWTTPAADNLEAIKIYLDTHHPAFSRPTIEKLYQAARSLKVMPRRGRPGKAAGTRELIQYPYIVVYRIKEDVVEILYIHHGAQNRMQ